MGALSDPKLEAFAQALLRQLAKGLTAGKAAEQAARDAGYGGSSIASNARKRAQRRDVKARMVELAAPKQAEAEAEIAETYQAVRSRLFRIALTPLESNAVKPSDQIHAATLLARIDGWLAPEKVEHSLNGLGDRIDEALARARAAKQAS